MHYDHAGIFEGSLVTKVVISIVADLIEGDVELGRIEGGGLGGERMYVSQPAEFIEEGGGIVRDSAFGRRER
jgi:hypothetical protein